MPVGEKLMYGEWPIEVGWYQPMLWKPKESTHNALFDGTKTKLFVSNSKSRIHEGWKVKNPPKKIIDKSLNFY